MKFHYLLNRRKLNKANHLPNDFRILKIIKIRKLLRTITAPDGRSKTTETIIPKSTEIIPKTTESTRALLKDREIERAVSEGITINAETRRIPTARMEITTTNAVKRESTNVTDLTLDPTII